MNALFQHWSLDPIILVVLFTAYAYELGLARMKAHSRPSSHLKRRHHSYFFHAGLVLILISVVSPLDYLASRYFYVHMIDHVVAAFFVPMAIVAGAPWIPLMFALPVRARRKVGRFF